MIIKGLQWNQMKTDWHKLYTVLQSAAGLDLENIQIWNKESIWYSAQPSTAGLTGLIKLSRCSAFSLSDWIRFLVEDKSKMLLRKNL